MADETPVTPDVSAPDDTDTTPAGPPMLPHSHGYLSPQFLTTMVGQVIGVIALSREIVFGVRAERLAVRLEAEDRVPSVRVPVLPSGRIDRLSADGMFDRFAREAEEDGLGAISKFFTRLAEVEKQAIRLDRTVSWLMAAAWAIAAPQIEKMETMPVAVVGRTRRYYGRGVKKA